LSKNGISRTSHRPSDFPSTPLNRAKPEFFSRLSQTCTTAKNPKEAADFIRFILSAAGQGIVLETGQPPGVPAVRKGSVPPDVTN